jgi:hypothetical protein
VADTWNRRIQSFVSSSAGTGFNSLQSWQVSGWASGISGENKPYLAITPDGDLLATDPDAGNILEYDLQGNYLKSWVGLYKEGENQPVFDGIVVDSSGQVWTVDSANNRIVRFNLS